MEWTLKKFDELTSCELYKILQERIHIFVVEQGCHYQECDDKDFKALHLFMKDDEGHIACYCRLLYPGVSYNEASIGRVLVHDNHRRKGLARKMIEKAVEVIKENMGENAIKISAQVYAKNLYEQVGFKECSEVYNEDSIPHVEMVYEGN